MYTPSLPRLTEEAQFGLVQPGQEFYLPNQPERYIKVSPHHAKYRTKYTFRVHSFHPTERVWRVVEQ
jgi:hypothetical protein